MKDKGMQQGSVALDASLPRGLPEMPAIGVAADQRRRLLAALPQAVAENGFGGMTVEHIVKLAQVRRNAFYEQFADKGECFTAAYEIAQERLFGVLTYRCYTSAEPAERVSSALRACLALLSEEPGLAHLLAVEAPAAGEPIATRHQEWLDRYGRLLQLVAVGSNAADAPRPALEPAIVGAIASRIKQLALAGGTGDLPTLHPELTELTLSFFGVSESVPAWGQGEDAEPAQPQPQSPERFSVLEAA